MRYRNESEVVEATQWFKNGDHPDDYAEDRSGFCDGVWVTFPASECRAAKWEGAVVRYYRHPQVPGDTPCLHCSQTMHVHGWIDTSKGGQTVCPGDMVVTRAGQYFSCKPDVFRAAYELDGDMTQAQGRFSITFAITGLDEPAADDALDYPPQPSVIDRACPHGHHVCVVCGENESARAKQVRWHYLHQRAAEENLTALRRFEANARALQARAVEDCFRLAAEVQRLQANEARLVARVAELERADQAGEEANLAAMALQERVHELEAEIRRLQEACLELCQTPAREGYVHCYPHKTSWVRGASDEGCPTCKLEDDWHATWRQGKCGR